jgi:hypothetical protein
VSKLKLWNIFIIIHDIKNYTFNREKHIRTNVSWHENGTISFNQIRRWHFMESLSTGKLSDNITNYNPIAAVRRHN